MDLGYLPVSTLHPVYTSASPVWSVSRLAINASIASTIRNLKGALEHETRSPSVYNNQGPCANDLTNSASSTRIVQALAFRWRANALTSAAWHAGVKLRSDCQRTQHDASIDATSAQRVQRGKAVQVMS
jgi:hypothetical protein